MNTNAGGETFSDALVSGGVIFVMFSLISLALQLVTPFGEFSPSHAFGISALLGIAYAIRVYRNNKDTTADTTA